MTRNTTNIGTRLALEDNAFAATADAATTTVQVQVLVYLAVDVVFIALIIIGGVVRAGGHDGRSCCGATAVERGNERWRLAPGDDEQNRMQVCTRS